jgi:hypothetical protein
MYKGLFVVSSMIRAKYKLIVPIKKIMMAKRISINIESVATPGAMLPNNLR